MGKSLELYDVTIIGGGPVGLFTAFYCGMREMKTKIIEFLPFLGGKVSYFYPDKTIRDIGGIPKITGRDLITQLKEQAMTFNPEIVLGQQVVGLERQPDGTFILISHTGEKHYTRTIILANGFGTLKSVTLDLPNAKEFEGHNLNYTVDALHSYKDKHVLISGGGNSACDWACELLHVARHVTIVHRRHEFRGLECSVSNLKCCSQARVMTPYVIDALHGENGMVTKATIKNVESGETMDLEVDEVLVNHGFSIDAGPISDWGLEIENGNMKVDEMMRTNIPGIFAAGDAANYTYKLPLIAGGFSEGPIAVNSAKAYLEPNKALKPLYSTIDF